MPLVVGGTDPFEGITEDYLVAYCDVLDDLHARHQNN